MENFDLIYKYLDDDLSSEQEDLLFSHLNNDPSLRAELKSLMNLKKIVSNKDMNYYSSEASKKQLFSNLGLGEVSLISNILMFLTIPALAILSYFAFEYFEHKEVQLADSTAEESQKIDIELPELIQQEINKISRFDLTNSRNTIQKFRDSKNQYLSNLNSSNVLTNSSEHVQDESENIIDLGNKIEQIVYPVISSNLFKNSFGFDVNSNRLCDLGVVRSEYEFNKKRIRLEFSNNNFWDQTPARVAPTRYQDFNNTSIKLSYNIYDNIELGLAYTRENFSLKFRGEEDGVLYDFYQQPNYSTFGILLGYSLKFKKYEPFVNFEGGVNATGRVLRAGLGLRYNINRSFGLQVNGAWNGMYYNRFGTQNLAEKYQFNYGLFVRI